MTVIGEKAFSVPSTAFGVSASNEQYTLNYSVDGVTFTPYEKSTPAGENLMVISVPKGMIFKLVGNNSTVKIRF